jgi:hypothetical protein
MAWRPTSYLIEGVLDNSVPNKVTGWLKFAGMKEKVTFDLTGNFHRDIRGAKVHLRGDGRDDDPDASGFMKGFSARQVGQVGDMTAGLPPHDYVKDRRGYFEWYSEDNGRVVLELDPEQVKVIGQPIPWIESDPVSREEQQGHMANFLAGLCRSVGAPVAVVVGTPATLVSDPAFSHWVVVENEIVGEAHSVEPGENGVSFAFVRLFAMPEMAEYGSIEAERLLVKNQAQAPGRAG